MTGATKSASADDVRAALEAMTCGPTETITGIFVDGTPIEHIPEVTMQLRGLKGWHQVIDGDRSVVYYDCRTEKALSVLADPVRINPGR